MDDGLAGWCITGAWKGARTYILIQTSSSLTQQVFVLCYTICSFVVASTANMGFNAVLTALLYIAYVAGTYHVLHRSKMPLAVRAGGRLNTAGGLLACQSTITDVLTSSKHFSQTQIGFVLGVSVMITFISLMTAVFWVRPYTHIHTQLVAAHSIAPPLPNPMLSMPTGPALELQPRFLRHQTLLVHESVRLLRHVRLCDPPLPRPGACVYHTSMHLMGG